MASAAFLADQAARMAKATPTVAPEMVSRMLGMFVDATGGDETAISQAVDGWVYRAHCEQYRRKARLN